ncbi:hypothetical protein [Desertihabitans aurantiacus]|uniref:hypothetical protein n=1 Tax=Desertihabitans aurantiacus TaxID=2282477 RepID=UPI000DF76448|nr:hypothetical protein [Desertihabitans aurantiacus]
MSAAGPTLAERLARQRWPLLVVALCLCTVFSVGWLRYFERATSITYVPTAPGAWVEVEGLRQRVVEWYLADSLSGSDDGVPVTPEPGKVFLVAHLEVETLLPDAYCGGSVLLGEDEQLTADLLPSGLERPVPDDCPESGPGLTELVVEVPRTRTDAIKGVTMNDPETGVAWVLRPPA